MASNDKPEPFPSLPGTTLTPPTPALQTGDDEQETSRRRASSGASATRNRGSSLLNSFVNSNPPLGMWAATGEVGSKLPTLGEIKNGAFADDGWSHEGQMERRGNNPHEIHRRRIARTSSASTRGMKSATTSPTTPATISEDTEFFPSQPTVQADTMGAQPENLDGGNSAVAGETVASSTSSTRGKMIGPDETGTYPNGYRFPRKHTWGQATVIGLKAFWRFAITPFGFIITIYGLNVVAWGAMIFFVLLEAAPALCHPSCSALDSPRKKWIEYDSQILNALFCVTGFGLIPWRFRDFYYLMQWRWKGKQLYFRKLAGIYRGWFRLPGSDKLPDDFGPPPVYDKKNPQPPESPPAYSDDEITKMEANPAIPMPVTMMPQPPLTGIRAPPTKPYMLDLVIWGYLLNTVFQACLAGCMWGLNRFNRPSWTTGLFISLGCVVAIAAGVVIFIEGSAVKKVEGIPVHEYDVLESIDDYQTRKAKEDAKLAKKHSHEKPGIELTRQVTKTEKVKGKHWYERH